MDYSDQCKIVETFSKKQHPKVKTDFENADTLYMINFITKNVKIFMNKSAFYNENPLEVFMNYKISVQNKMAHGVAGENG
jgi:hypothetical protein